MIKREFKVRDYSAGHSSGRLSRFLCLGLIAATAVFVLVLSLAGGPAQAVARSGAGAPQDPNLDYSVFKHRTPGHAAQKCTDCHRRSADNSVTQAFPGHEPCLKCHTGQFVTQGMPMCLICHSDLKGKDPARRPFPTKFKESFNVKFSHSLHLTGAARPTAGCNGCHDKPLNRGVALSIPQTIAAHNQCYSCHKPGSKSAAGVEIESCGVCHDEKPNARMSTNARAFRLAFSHAQHRTGRNLQCASCHTVTAALLSGKQISSPSPTEHFAGGGKSCQSCHNGKSLFGDVAFKDCKRCHSGATFKM